MPLSSPQQTNFHAALAGPTATMAAAPSSGTGVDAPASLPARLVAIRRDLHAHPELAFEEERTCGIVCARLDELGVAYERIARTAVVATIPASSGSLDPPFVALRADMDALPIAEATGVAFSSAVEGAMHACGHDGHTAIGLGATELLVHENRAGNLQVPVKVFFQPAEEVGGGAKAMIADGAMEGVERVFGGHIDVMYRPGEIVVHDGCVNASTDPFTIEVKGTGGHAARPHFTVDALLVGAHVVTALQSIVSRRVDPSDSAVVTVGRFEAGTAGNVVAATCRMEGTVRTQDTGVRTAVLQHVRNVADTVGSLHGARASVTFHDAVGMPPNVNDSAAVGTARAAAKQVLEPAALKAAGVPAGAGLVARMVPELRSANMGGEDFAWFSEMVPTCYVRFGAAVDSVESASVAAGTVDLIAIADFEAPSYDGDVSDDGRDLPPHVFGPAHSPTFTFDERVLTIGSRFLARVAVLAGRELAAAASASATGALAGAGATASRRDVGGTRTGGMGADAGAGGRHKPQSPAT